MDQSTPDPLDPIGEPLGNPLLLAECYKTALKIYPWSVPPLFCQHLHVVKIYDDGWIFADGRPKGRA